MFKKYLQENNLEDLLQRVPYSAPSFSHEERVFEFLDDIRLNNRKVLQYGDYDVDGAMCNFVIKDSLEAMGVTPDRHFYVKYTQHTHNVDYNVISLAIQNNVDYVVIGDTGSSDKALLQQLTNYGIKVIVLDHHNTEEDYESFGEDVAIINTIKENEILGEKRYALSAGALCFCVFDKYLQQYCDIDLDSIKVYAFCSLYADSMDMANELNRSIYWAVMELDLKLLPRMITCFMRKGSMFDRRYVEFWFAPRINALFRGEVFDLLNVYMFSALNDEELTKCVDIIENVYDNSRNMVQVIADVVNVVQIKHYVICDLNNMHSLNPDDFKALKNYTGLIANKLASRYRKTAVVYCKTNDFYKGSVRDPHGTNQLRIFKQICKADGHNPAFGFKVGLMELNKFLKSLQKIDEYYSISVKDEMKIVFDMEVSIPDMADLERMCLYNDFAGKSLPYAFVRKTLAPGMPQLYSQYYYKYEWGEAIIRGEYAIDLGTVLEAKPIKRQKVTLMVS